MTTFRAGQDGAPDHRIDAFATFSTSVSRVDTQVVVRIGGELDIFSAASLRSTLLDLIDGQGNLAVVVDLEELEFIDSTGLNVLLTAQRRCRTHGGEVSLTNPQPVVRRLLQLTAMDKVFTITP